MLTQDQLKQLISANQSLQVQLEEANMILSEREEQLLILRENAARNNELQSIADARLDELYSMQNLIGKKDQEAAGAEERELELQQELTEAARLQQQYNALAEQYDYLQARFDDLEDALASLKHKHLLLQQIAAKIGELESHLANTVMERDELAARLSNRKSKAEDPNVD